MKIIHNHLQIHSETSKDSKFEGQGNKLLKAYAYKKQNIQKSMLLTFIYFFIFKTSLLILLKFCNTWTTVLCGPSHYRDRRLKVQFQKTIKVA